MAVGVLRGSQVEHVIRADLALKGAAHNLQLISILSFFPA